MLLIFFSVVATVSIIVLHAVACSIVYFFIYFY